MAGLIGSSQTKQKWRAWNDSNVRPQRSRQFTFVLELRLDGPDGWAIEFRGMSDTRPCLPIATTARILGIDEERGPARQARFPQRSQTAAAAAAPAANDPLSRMRAVNIHSDPLPTLPLSGIEICLQQKSPRKREFLQV